MKLIQYTGTKTIGATPMTRGKYNEYRGWDIPSNEDPNEAGYLVEYPVEVGTTPNHPDHEGYISWSPAIPFEKAYIADGSLSITEEIETLAGRIYERYCKAVGGKAFNGDPLPKWAEFEADPAKAKQATAWKLAAAHAMIALNAPHPKRDSMTFGQALEALKAGKRVARAGWNGKGMWLSLSGNANETKSIPAPNFWSENNKAFAYNHKPSECVDVLPCITMKTADDKILMGWLASQTDMLSEDWCIV